MGFPNQNSNKTEQESKGNATPSSALTDDDIRILARFVVILGEVQKREELKQKQNMEKNNEEDNSKNEKTEIRSKKRSRQ